jgi:hypothetical protein
LAHNPLDYVDGVALGKHLRSNPVPKVKTYQGPPINIDAVAKGARNRKAAKKYPKNNIPKGKI